MTTRDPKDAPGRPPDSQGVYGIAVTSDLVGTGVQNLRAYEKAGFARWRTVEVPGDLASVLAADTEAARAFEQLSFTHRTEYVRWITSARRDETRWRRLGEVPELLKQGRRTPL